MVLVRTSAVLPPVVQKVALPNAVVPKPAARKPVVVLTLALPKVVALKRVAAPMAPAVPKLVVVPKVPVALKLDLAPKGVVRKLVVPKAVVPKDAKAIVVAIGMPTATTIGAKLDRRAVPVARPKAVAAQVVLRAAVVVLARPVSVLPAVDVDSVLPAAVAVVRKREVAKEVFAERLVVATGTMPRT